MVAIFPSHANFAQAALALVDKYKLETAKPCSGELGPALTNAGWTWMDHPKYPTFGYLRRTSTHLVPASASPSTASILDEAEIADEDTLLEEPDPSSAPPAPTSSSSLPPEVISVIHHIVYSPTYRAPHLLLQAHSQTTHFPLSLPSLISLSLIRLPHHAVPTAAPALDPNASSLPLNPPPHNSPWPSSQEFADDDSDELADFPLLAQAEHPSTSEGVWALHPCHTQQAVEEVVGSGDGLGGEQGGLEWLEAWLMVVGTVVDLRWRSQPFII